MNTNFQVANAFDIVKQLWSNKICNFSSFWPTVSLFILYNSFNSRKFLLNLVSYSQIFEWKSSYKALMLVSFSLFINSSELSFIGIELSDLAVIHISSVVIDWISGGSWGKLLSDSMQVNCKSSFSNGFLRLPESTQTISPNFLGRVYS